MRYRNDPETMKREDRFVFLSVFLMLLLNLPASYWGLGWQSAAFNTGLVCLVFAVYIVRKRSARLLGWAMLGVAAGFTELMADWWLVNKTQSLVYAPGEPFIVASPIYMPFAWALIILQTGVIAQWLKRRLPAGLAMIIAGLFGGLNIPLYEHLAHDANWWIYRDTPMLFNAPYYIILGEFLLVLPLVWMAGVLERRRRQQVTTGLALGVLEGLIIWAAYWIAWQLVGPCQGALIQLPCG